MKLLRRQFLHLVAGTTALSTMSRIAGAQGYPIRPVRWIVGFPPGGSYWRIISPPKALRDKSGAEC